MQQTAFQRQIDTVGAVAAFHGSDVSADLRPGLLGRAADLHFAGQPGLQALALQFKVLTQIEFELYLRLQG